MDNSLNKTGMGGSDPAPDTEDLRPNGSNGVLTTVPALRPYAYRRPTGRPQEDDTAHPVRRRGDFDPQK